MVTRMSEIFRVSIRVHSPRRWSAGSQFNSPAPLPAENRSPPERSRCVSRRVNSDPPARIREAESFDPIQLSRASIQRAPRCRLFCGGRGCLGSEHEARSPVSRVSWWLVRSPSGRSGLSVPRPGDSCALGTACAKRPECQDPNVETHSQCLGQRRTIRVQASRGLLCHLVDRFRRSSVSAPIDRKRVVGILREVMTPYK